LNERQAYDDNTLQYTQYGYDDINDDAAWPQQPQQHRVRRDVTNGSNSIELAKSEMLSDVDVQKHGGNRAENTYDDDSDYYDAGGYDDESIYDDDHDYRFQSSREAAQHNKVSNICDMRSSAFGACGVTCHNVNVAYFHDIIRRPSWSMHAL